MARQTIRFLRRGQVVELSSIPPTRTLLDYLRLEEKSQGHQRRLQRRRLRRLHRGAGFA